MLLNEKRIITAKREADNANQVREQMAKDKTRHEEVICMRDESDVVREKAHQAELNTVRDEVIQVKRSHLTYKVDMDEQLQPEGAYTHDI